MCPSSSQVFIETEVHGRSLSKLKSLPSRGTSFQLVSCITSTYLCSTLNVITINSIHKEPICCSSHIFLFCSYFKDLDLLAAECKYRQIFTLKSLKQLKGRTCSVYQLPPLYSLSKIWSCTTEFSHPLIAILFYLYIIDPSLAENCIFYGSMQFTFWLFLSSRDGKFGLS